MTEDEISQLVSELEGVRVLVASEQHGAPEGHWGDRFFYFDPQRTEDQKLPFATIVRHDTPGWDEVSDLDRPGAFRVNLAVGRDEVPPAHAGIDYAQDDVVLPHPQYAAQGWVSIVNPGPATSAQLRELISTAHARAARRHR